VEGDGEGNLEIRPAVAGSRMRGKIRPYYAPNPLRGGASKGFRCDRRLKRGLKGEAEGLD